MLTQREKLKVLTKKLEQHDFFNGPYMISRQEAQVILKSMRLHSKDLERGHKRYLDNQEEIIQQSKDRYRKLKQMEAK